MENITIIPDEQRDGTIIEQVIIDHGDGSFTTMTKEHYDKQQAEQSTPSLTDEAATK
jgi:hypothetical protein